MNKERELTVENEKELRLIGKRIEAIERHIKLLDSEERVEKLFEPYFKRIEQTRSQRRELGWLFLGVALGGAIGIVGDLTVAYFIEWSKSVGTSITINSLVASLIALVSIIVVTLYLGNNLIKKSRIPIKTT